MTMSKGGARNRSGPAPDPRSRTSERKGYTLTALPSEGYDGEPPEFPLMRFTVYRWEYEDKRRYQVFDEDATAAFRDREVALWEQVWTYPQACAWSLESWRWNTVAMWVRTQVVCESADATAADKGAIHRFADQIGMTPAGLKENGWAIAQNELAKRQDNADPEPAEGDEVGQRRQKRLR